MARKPFRTSKSVRRVKRIMRNLPDAAQAELVGVLEKTGPRLVNLIKARTPVRTGALSRGIKFRVAKRGLKLRAGLLGSPKARGKLFYGYILNWGRKAGPVKARRRTKTGTSNYMLNVKGITGSRFVTGTGKLIGREVQPQLQSIWARILKRAAGGAGE